MTKIVVHFRLEKPLTEAMLAGIREVHAIYGIARISLSKAMDSLTVEYDATRLRPAEVESKLRMHGLPVVPA